MLSLEFLNQVHAHSTLLFSWEAINEALNRTCAIINHDFQNTNPLFVCCMNGGLLTTAEVAKRLQFPLQLDYVDVSRYENDYSGATLKWLKTHKISPYGRAVLLIDDIIDGGLTLAQIKHYYKQCQAASVSVMVTFDKQTTRHKGGLKKADYHALNLPDQFVYGFGLDYHGYMRNLKSVYAVSEAYKI